MNIKSLYLEIFIHTVKKTQNIALKTNNLTDVDRSLSNRPKKRFKNIDIVTPNQIFTNQMK